MSRTNPSTAKPPAHHTKMLEDCIAKGWIIRVGDSYEITQKGHEYTMAMTASLPTTSTFEGNEEGDEDLGLFNQHSRYQPNGRWPGPRA